MTTSASKAERDVWAKAWKTPQAAAWVTEPWRWRTVALWVRWSVRMEDADATAAVATAARQLADQIGLTPAGLAENRWEIEESPTTGEPAAPTTPSRVPKAEKVTDPRTRLTVLDGGAAAGGG